MIGRNRRLRQVVGAAWLVLQSLALLVILFTPLWIRPGDTSLGERFRRVSPPEFSARTSSQRQPTSITSRVIAIPGPGFRSALSRHEAEWSEELEADVRQVRFEWALGYAPLEDWRLRSIERRGGGGAWEPISLVANEYGIPIGSVYVELAHGENVFSARVENAKTKDIKRIVVRVAQKR